MEERGMGSRPALKAPAPSFQALRRGGCSREAHGDPSEYQEIIARTLWFQMGRGVCVNCRGGNPTTGTRRPGQVSSVSGLRQLLDQPVACT